MLCFHPQLQPFDLSHRLPGGTYCGLLRGPTHSLARWPSLAVKNCKNGIGRRRPLAAALPPQATMADHPDDGRDELKGQLVAKAVGYVSDGALILMD